jgi:hypothetical protein
MHPLIVRTVAIQIQHPTGKIIFDIRIRFGTENYLNMFERLKANRPAHVLNLTEN